MSTANQIHLALQHTWRRRKTGQGISPRTLGISLLALVFFAPHLALAQSALDSRFTTVVTASRTEQRLSEAATPIDVITRAEIERSGARDASEVLALHPAVQLERGFAGAGALIQGLDSQHVLVLVDGQRVIGRTSGVIDLSRFPVERIEQIEITRGASSVLYGSDALGGVINILTRKANRRFEGDATMQYGALNSVDLRGSAGTRLRIGSITLNAGWHRRDAYRLGEDQIGTSGSGFDEQQISGRADLRLAKRLRLGINSAYLRRRQEGVDSYDTGAILDRTNLTETIDVGLTPELSWGAARLRLTTQYSYFRSQFLLDQRQGTQLDQFQDTREHLFRADAQLDWNLPRNNTLSAGGELLYERLYTDRLSTGFGDRVRGALFVQDQWRIVKKVGLFVVPALRFDADSQFGTNFAPKLAVRMAPISALILRASYGQGFRAPTFKELLLLFENPGVGYVVEGNLSLRPETSHSVNGGFELTPRAWVTLSANGYYNRLQNLIQANLAQAGSEAGPQRFSYGNIASAETRGVELSLRMRYVEKIALELGYTLTDSLDHETQQELAGRARHRGNATLTLRQPGWGLDFMTRLSVVGTRNYYADDDVDGVSEAIVAAPYVLWDARLSLSLYANVQAFLGAQNMLDAGERRFVPIPPRMAFLGISGRFEKK